MSQPRGKNPPTRCGEGRWAIAWTVALVVSLALEPVCAPAVLLAFISWHLAAVSGGNGLDRLLLAAAAAPAVNALILLVLWGFGAANRPMLALCYAAASLASFAAVRPKRAAAGPAGDGLAASLRSLWHPLWTIPLAALLPHAWLSLAGPYAHLFNGHYWSLIDVARYTVEKGRFPILPAGEVTHACDHIYYNPAVTAISASLHLFSDSLLSARRMLHAVTIVYTLLSWLALARCAQITAGGAGAAGAVAALLTFTSDTCTWIMVEPSHDSLTLFYCAFFLALAGGWLRRGLRPAAGAAALGVAGAGLARPYLAPLLPLWLFVISPWRGLRPRMSEGWRLLGGSVSRRQWFGIAAGALLGLSWNVFLLVHYSNFFFPHQVAAFGVKFYSEPRLPEGEGKLASNRPPNPYGESWSWARVNHFLGVKNAPFPFVAQAASGVLLAFFALYLFYLRGGGACDSSAGAGLAAAALAAAILWFLVPPERQTTKLLLPALASPRETSSKAPKSGIPNT